MIKVLFFIPSLGHGGAERVLVNLVNHMDKSKFDITVQTMFDVGIYQNQLEEKVKYIGGLKWYFPGNTKVYKLFSPKQLYKFYIKKKYDIIVSYLEGPSARVVSGCTDDVKLVSWIHIEQISDKYVTQVFRNMREANNCYNKYDEIVCVSDTVKQDFQNIFNINKVPIVLYNTVETDVIKEKSIEQVEDIQFDENEINLCSVAKLMKSKGYDRLIPVCKKLLDNGLPVHLYLVGKGEEKESLTNQAKELGISDKVTFVGFKSNPYKYVKNSDLYVCSSRREGFSTAVTESLVVGTPVVSTNCSGAVELLGENNEYGIVTENNEEALYQGVKEMLTGEKGLEYYKQKAQERGKKFDTEETVKAVEDMLMEVLNR